MNDEPRPKYLENFKLGKIKIACVSSIKKKQIVVLCNIYWIFTLIWWARHIEYYCYRKSLYTSVITTDIEQNKPIFVHNMSMTKKFFYFWLIWAEFCLPFKTSFSIFSIWIAKPLSVDCTVYHIQITSNTVIWKL